MEENLKCLKNKICKYNIQYNVCDLEFVQYMSEFQHGFSILHAKLIHILSLYIHILHSMLKPFIYFLICDIFTYHFD